MIDFLDKFKNYSNSELFKIIDSQADYQPAAVEAAKSILAGRQLSDQEIENARAELSVQQQEEELKNQKKKEIENKVKEIGNSIIENVNPIQTKEVTADKMILIISIVLGLISIKKNYQEFAMLRFMLSDDRAGWDLSMLLYIFPIILLPLGTVLFWRRKKSGWLLLVIYLTYTAIGAIISIILGWNLHQSGVGSLDNLFPSTSLIVFVWSFVFNGGILWGICKTNIRNVYNVNTRNIFTSIGIGVLFTILTIVGVFL